MSNEILAAFNAETGTWDVIDEDDFYDMDKPEEALQKAYKKGRKDAFTQIQKYLVDELFGKNEKLKIGHKNSVAKEEGEQNG